MSFSNNFPTTSPSLELDFANVNALDPRITFTRSSIATVTNSLGLLQTVQANTPRFDFDPVTLAAKGLLIEEQRTNLLTYSEQFDNAAWTKQLNVTITANSAVAPDGTTTAETFASSGITNNGFYQLPAGSNSTTYTGSIYLKAGTASVVQFGLTINGETSTAYYSFDLSAGTSTVVTSGFISQSASITPVGNGWYRCVVSGTTPATGVTNIAIFPKLFAAANVFVWGAQLEAGSFATSYIPTVASQVTRSADVASVNTLSPWYNATEGTLYAEYTPYALTADSRFASIDDGTTANRIMIWGTSGSARTIFNVRSSSVDQADLQAASTFTTNTTKTAGAYKLNDFAFSVNGAAAVTDTSGSIPAVTQLVIGGASGSAAKIHGHIRRITYYPRRLSNTNLQALTS